VWTVAVFICLGWIGSVCIHEFGHAVVAYWGGDTSVQDKGYLTLNPFKYTEPTLSLLLPILFLLMGGIALPGGAVYIDRNRLRSRWWESAVSAAGPFASAVVTFLLAIPFWLGLATPSREDWIWPSLAFLIFLGIASVLLNLLPIPPLDGYGIIEPWLPRRTQIQLNKFGKHGIWVIFVLLWSVQPLNQFYWSFTYTISEALNVPTETAELGYELFRKNSSLLIFGFICILLLFPAKEIKWYNRGITLGNLQQYEEAIAYFDRAIQIKPDLPYAWYCRGLALNKLKRYEEAIASYDRAIQIKPDYSKAWYNKACCYAEQGNIPLTIETLQQAINLDPDKVKEQAKIDSSFDAIRENQLFKNLIGE